MSHSSSHCHHQVALMPHCRSQGPHQMALFSSCSSISLLQVALVSLLNSILGPFPRHQVALMSQSSSQGLHQVAPMQHCSSQEPHQMALLSQCSSQSHHQVALVSLVYPILVPFFTTRWRHRTSGFAPPSSLLPGPRTVFTFGSGSGTWLTAVSLHPFRSASQHLALCNPT